MLAPPLQCSSIFLVSQINKVKWYSILCDEVTDVSVKEQVSVAMWYVDSQCNVPEELLDFLSTQERYWLVCLRCFNIALILETVGVRGMILCLIWLAQVVFRDVWHRKTSKLCMYTYNYIEFMYCTSI